MLTDWDYTQVHDFDKIREIWDGAYDFDRISNELKNRLNLPITDMNTEQSKFFKHHYQVAHKNHTAMRTELSVIRSVEGW
jgi:hypothetical protein